MSGPGLISIGLLILLSIPIVLTDLKERRIPDVWNFALGVVGLGIALARSLHWRVLGAAALDAAETLVVFWGLVWLARLLKRPSGLGMGDVKFLTAASLWVGFGGACILFVLASLLIVLSALVVAPWKGLDLKTPRPFGPMLAASLLAVAVIVQVREGSA